MDFGGKIYNLKMYVYSEETTHSIFMKQPTTNSSHRKKFFRLQTSLAMSLAVAVTAFGGAATVAQNRPELYDGNSIIYEEEELERVEDNINVSIEDYIDEVVDGEEDENLLEDNLNIYSEDEYDVFEGADAYEVEEYPEADVYEEQPGVYNEEIR